MSHSTLPIVGVYHHPPALALIAALPIDTPLTLMAEPDNEHDPNAIGVWLDAKHIPAEAYPTLRETLAEFGCTLEQVLDNSPWMLGYIPREFAAQLKAANIVTNSELVPVTFAVNAKGAPRVRFAEPVL